VEVDWDHASLLLSKWGEESTNVSAILFAPGVALRFIGKVSEVNAYREEASLVAADGLTRIKLLADECGFAFDDHFDLPDYLAEWLPRQWESMLVVELPIGYRLFLFA
jgi:hypothetical protein